MKGFGQGEAEAEVEVGVGRDGSCVCVWRVRERVGVGRSDGRYVTIRGGEDRDRSKALLSKTSQSGSREDWPGRKQQQYRRVGNAAYWNGSFMKKEGLGRIRG